MRSISQATAVVIALLSTSCSGPEARIPEAAVTDSAGVRILTFDLEQLDLPMAWILGEPGLEIGEVSGASEYTFSRIADLATTSDGSIVVSDGAAQELRAYDASGKHLSTIGRSGDGPGEFTSSPLIAGLDGDAVFAYDVRASRITQFSLEDGDLIETVPLGRNGTGRPTSVKRLTDGTYLSRSGWNNGAMSAHEPRIELDSIVIEHLDRAGGLIDTVRVMADRRRVRAVQPRPDGQVSVIQGDPPFSPNAVVLSDGARTIVGHSDAFEFTWISPEGTTVLRVLGVQHSATAADIRAYQESAVREDIGEDQLDPMTRRLLFDFLPDRLPAFGDAVVSDDGELWVSLTEFDLSEGLNWLVFEVTGELKGTVRTPPELRLKSVTDRSIVGVVTGDFDVPIVRRYPLLPPPA